MAERETFMSEGIEDQFRAMLGIKGRDELPDELYEYFDVYNFNAQRLSLQTIPPHMLPMIAIAAGVAAIPPHLVAAEEPEEETPREPETTDEDLPGEAVEDFDDLAEGDAVWARFQSKWRECVYQGKGSVGGKQRVMIDGTERHIKPELVRHREADQDEEDEADVADVMIH